MSKKRILAAGLSATFLIGCAELPSRDNWVHPHWVMMERTDEEYLQDLKHCRKIAESRDYYTRNRDAAVKRVALAALFGATVGAGLGAAAGNAAAGAAGGASGMMLNNSVHELHRGQRETATVIWARCMKHKGHGVYSIYDH